jgi:hypothetical protein
MCQSTEDLKRKAEWSGAVGDSRHKLLSDLSSMFTIASSRSSSLIIIKDVYLPQLCYQNIGSPYF